MPPSPILLLLLLAAYVHGGINADPTPTEPPDPRSKSLILVKVWSSIIFFVATFLARVLPHLLKRNERLIQVGAQFAGGVFLGTALLQFLSDSDQAFDHLKAKDKFYYYPFAFLLASVGYLLTLLIDCVVLWVHRKQRRSSDGVTVRLPGTSCIPYLLNIQIQCSSYYGILKFINKRNPTRQPPSFMRGYLV